MKQSLRFSSSNRLLTACVVASACCFHDVAVSVAADRMEPISYLAEDERGNVVESECPGGVAIECL